MRRPHRTARHLLLAGLAAALLLSACATDEPAEDGRAAEGTEAPASTAPVGATGAEPTGDLADLFDDGALVADAEVVDCALEDGTATTCHQLTVTSQPSTVDTGPFCPTTVDSDEHGIFTWDGDDPGLYALDADFWAMVEAQGYDFVEADGAIRTADPAGARPDGDACLQATPDGSYTLQVLLPVEPVVLDEPTDLGTVSQVGLAVDGITVFGDAPSGTSGAIPALDHCGGHDDPSGYYHWHVGSSTIQAVLDAAGVEVTCSVDQDASALFGFAFDGFPIYGTVEADGSEPVGLDACGGHVGDTADLGEAYHYHLSSEAPNLPTCRVGAVAEAKLTSPDNAEVSLPDTGGPGGAGAPGGPPPGAPDEQSAAPVLGTDGSAHCHTVDGDGAPVCH